MFGGKIRIVTGGDEPEALVPKPAAPADSPAPAAPPPPPKPSEPKPIQPGQSVRFDDDQAP
jgi:hypothetical protein